MNPIVLLLSYGEIKPKEIVDNIIQADDGTVTDEDVAVGSNHYKTYKYNITTKYYQNTVSLLPYEGDIDSVPSDVLKLTEGLIVFFEPKNKSFLKIIPNILNLVKENEISFGILLTSKFCDDSILGITYKEIRNVCPIDLDIIELCNELDEKESTLKDQHEYYELTQALHNILWSNVIYPNTDCERPELHSSMESLEEQLEAFEGLLNNIQNFKKVSSTMGRDEVLDQAEKLAERFTNIMMKD